MGKGEGFAIQEYIMLLGGEKVAEFQNKNATQPTLQLPNHPIPSPPQGSDLGSIKYLTLVRTISMKLKSSYEDHHKREL